MTTEAAAAIAWPSPSFGGGQLVWQTIAIAPTDRNVEVAVIDKDGAHPVVVPCRLTAGGWIDAVSKRHLDIRPTHWRPWGLAAATRRAC